MKILVRLPNWLGDMIMAVGFLKQLPHFFSHCEISVIAKKGLHGLLPHFPPTGHQFIFSKDEYKGLTGLWQFGKEIKKAEAFDLFFCLPDSFSSALMGWATGAKARVGYKKELRNLLLTHAYEKGKALHRVEEYIALLEMYTKQKAITPDVALHHSFKKENYIVVNVNSEAQSRRLTLPKAIEVVEDLKRKTDLPIYLIGAPKEKPFIDEIFAHLAVTNGIENLAGKTALPQLIQLLASARVMLTTDSGPAHLANALQTPTVVLFGAGNEANTSPYNKEYNTVIRLGKLSCEPCTKNVCVKYETPQCLVQLSADKIVQTVIEKLNLHEGK
jgi:heptosyltransferase II